MAAPAAFTLSTIGAPFGRYMIGPKKKKMAHFWPGRDGLIHAFIFKEDAAPVAAGPWPDRYTAEAALVVLLTPKAAPVAGGRK